MANIGELWVSLGFDVDDTKLKDFNSSLKGTLNTMLELAGVSLSVAGFAHLMDGASQSAVKLQQLNVELGINTQAAQRYALALHQINPSIGVEQGIESYRKFTAMLKQEIELMGQGQIGPLSLLTGGNVRPGMNEEDALKAIAANKKNFMASQGPNSEAVFSKYLDSVGLGAGASRMFDLTEKQIDQMTAGLVVEQNTIDNLGRLANAAAIAGESLSKLGMDTANAASGKTEKFLRGFTGLIQAVDQGKTGEFLSKNWSWSEFGNQLTPDWLINGAHHLSKLSDKYDDAESPIAPMYQKGKSKDAVSYFAQEWGPEKATGIVKRLMMESGLRTNAVGDHGQAYGIAQWHPDRQAAFKKVFGHDIHTSSLDEQMQFVNYELLKGNERRAGEKLKSAKAADSYATFTNEYERPAVRAVTQNNHTIINSNQPAAELKRAWDGQNQAQLKHAYSNIVTQ